MLYFCTGLCYLRIWFGARDMGWFSKVLVTAFSSLEFLSSLKLWDAQARMTSLLMLGHIKMNGRQLLSLFSFLQASDTSSSPHLPEFNCQMTDSTHIASKIQALMIYWALMKPEHFPSLSFLCFPNSQVFNVFWIGTCFFLFREITVNALPSI